MIASSATHLKNNPAMWSAIFAVLAIITGGIRYYVSIGTGYNSGIGSQWGDATALFGSLSGCFIMIWSESGFVRPDEDAEA
jgi:hypothetical protein